MTIGETRQRPKTTNNILKSQACEKNRFFSTQDFFDLDFHSQFDFFSSFGLFWCGGYKKKPNQVFVDLFRRLFCHGQMHVMSAWSSSDSWLSPMLARSPSS